MDPVSVAVAGSSLVGGIGSMIGQYSANKANLKIAREQMAFQERMSNTAHQREAEDLRKAGMNPLLTAGGSGSSTPSGASATMGNVGEAGARHIDPMMILNIQQSRANIGKTRAETLVADNTAKNLDEQNRLIQAQIGRTNAQTYVDQWNAAKIEAELSGTTVFEAGFKLFGAEFKWQSKSYDNQKPPVVPSPAAGSSSDLPWRDQLWSYARSPRV